MTATKVARRPFDYDGPACVHFSEVGTRIAAASPIAGAMATNPECEARDLLVREACRDAELPTETRDHPNRRNGAVSPLHRWYTTVMTDGSMAGVWADSAGEAIIVTALWRGVGVARVFDDDGAVLLRSGKTKAPLSLEVTLW
jgi:hypothetical protein